jgi:hypothetical protein
MTIPATDRKAGPLLGNGAQTSWPFTFKVFADSDIQVTVANVLGVETLLTLGTDYTVALNVDQVNNPGGTVTYPVTGSPLMPGGKLTITGYVDFDQPLDLPEGGNFSATALENQLDRTVMQIQQLRDSVNRAVQVGVTTDVEVTLPPPAPNRLIAWNADGTGLQNLPIQDLATGVAFVAYRYDTFTGDGVSTSFPLTVDPTVIGNVYVTVGGVGQLPVLDWNLINGSLDFAVAPPIGAKILAHYGEAPSGTTPTGSPVTFVPTVQSLAGNGTTTAFTLNNNPGSAAALIVRINGAVQTPGTDFNVSGTTLTFTDAPPAGTTIVVQDFGAAVPVGTAAASSVAYLNSTKLDQYIGPTSGSAALRVDLATGNVGLGVTPSAWSAGFTALEMPNGNALYSNGAQASIASNAYNDGVWKYKTTGTAGLYGNVQGVHQWFVAASGAAGNAITFTQAMTLDTTNTLRLFGTTSGSVGLKGQAAAGSTVYTLPPDGSSGQFLRTDGLGVLSWVTISPNAISANNSNVTVNDTGANSTITHVVDGSTIATINAAGIALGVTPSPSAGTTRAFEAAGFVLTGTNGGDFVLAQNSYWDGSAWRFKNNGWMSLIQGGTGSGGVIDFKGSFISGTAGNTVNSFNDLLQLNGPNAAVIVQTALRLHGAASVNINSSTYSITAQNHTVRFNTTNCTLTLPAANAGPGRLLFLSNVGAVSVTSASSNVCPLGSDTAGTAILAATSGKFSVLWADSAANNWKTILAN